MSRSPTARRWQGFCERFGLRRPILLAPMAGVPALALSLAVMRAGGLGSLGALMLQPDEIVGWAAKLRAASSAPFQINLWIPDPPPRRDAGQETAMRQFLAAWGPPPVADAGDASPPDFAAQCEALLAAAPPLVSSVMGLYPTSFVAKLKARNIGWIANISTVSEARAAEAAGADLIVAQGMEAGGHRGCFDEALAERQMVGLIALLPAVVDAVTLPVVATGGIADGRGIAAALALGASAVQLGSAFLRCPEAGIAPSWAAALGRVLPEDTQITRAFSGRAGRAIATAFVRVQAETGPAAAPYPIQRGLTAAMRAEAVRQGRLDSLQAWSGQAAALGPTRSAEALVDAVWNEACALLA